MLAPSSAARRLAAATTALFDVDPADTGATVAVLRSGLAAAYAGGLAVALDPRWRLRHTRAGTVEFDLAYFLACVSATIRDVEVPDRIQDSEALFGTAADAAVAAIAAYCRAASLCTRQAAERCPDRSARTDLMRTSGLWNALDAAWTADAPTQAEPTRLPRERPPRVP
ncbi:hypothetical protein [Amycolatopsis rubida]|uniref:Uncharacterized protein n=1 Tax=Amycolatopsis rubida TaxID=112413 RepID=A0A1I5XFW6_9PSEU|nr:hypothetical protein [Amycolatopsis rubida]SFQ30557.1 hypothetical protein SAMN05421854_110190 [Amycolatopsis rubida]